MVVEMNHDYTTYLTLALETLFRPTKDKGFWDEKEGRIVRALNYTINKGKIVWSSVDASMEWRYAPFALMGVLQWRVSDISEDIYDLKIKMQLDYFTKKFVIKIYF